jgi:hypothetical protein
MPGLVPGIHAFRLAASCKDVDGRDKPGHDDVRGRGGGYFTPSFFCRLDDDVVYWKISFLFG